MSGRKVVVFNLGGVLIDWDPRHLYRKLFDDEAEMERFLSTVCTPAWNREQDAGRLCADAARVFKADHPEQAHLIDAYYVRSGEMMPGPIAGSVDILGELHARGTPLYALTNFSAETYSLACRQFAFLGWFRGVLVSGEEKVINTKSR